MDLTVRVEDAGQLAPDWRALLERAFAPTVFQLPAWHEAWWTIFQPPGDPLCYTVRSGDGELLGLAPMRRREDGVLVLAGDPEICDYMDVIAPEGLEPPVLAALIEQWQGEGAPAVEFWGLREDSPTRRVLGCGEGVPETHCEQEAVAPRIPLRGDWESYLLRLSKKDRHELRRKMRRLESAGMTVALDVAGAPREVARDMEHFFRLHTISRQDKAEFMTEEMRAFFGRVSHALAEEGMTRLFLLRLDGELAACVLAFANADLAIWNSGFDPRFAYLSVGLLAKVKAIRWAQEHGHGRVDLLRGQEAYKYDLGAEDYRIFRCRLTVG